MKAKSCLILAAVTLLPHFRALADDSPVDVRAVVWQNADELKITFSADEADETGDFFVQKTPDLASGSWTPIGASIQSLGGGTWQVIVQAPQHEPRGFFRIVRSDGEPVTVAFPSQATEVREGANATVRVQFSRPFTGTLRFAIDKGDGETTGQIAVGGKDFAEIPISDLADDRSANTLGYLTIRILDGDGYDTLGGTSVIVEDNDAVWGGVLDSEGDKVDVAMRLLTTEQDGVGLACIKTDGAGLFPPNPAGDGDWLFSDFTLTASEFNGTVGPVVVPADETIYGAPTELTLSFSTAGGGSVGRDKLQGTFTLTTTVPSLPHLSFPERTGNFAFFRQATTPADLSPPVAP